MPNIREVARVAGVSVATVSRVLNHPEKVSFDTREKIDRVIEELDFSPNSLARGLNLKGTTTIALVIPDLRNPLYTEIARGVEAVAHRKGYNLLLCHTEKDSGKERSYIRMLAEKKIDGVILAYTILDTQDFIDIRGHNIRVFLFGQDGTAEGISSIYSDFRRGAYLAVTHLANLGYRRIAYIRGADRHMENRRKTLGFREALEEAGLEGCEDFLVRGNDDIDGGYLAALQLLQQKPRPDAVFAGNDLMAVGALDAFRAEGLRVPDDISLIGYDDIRMASLVEPKLTTVSWPVHKMGLIAARIIIEEIETGDKTAEIQNIFLQPKLKIRKSCGRELRVNEIFN